MVAIITMEHLASRIIHGVLVKLDALGILGILLI
jgi:hypothetical protein